MRFNKIVHAGQVAPIAIEQARGAVRVQSDLTTMRGWGMLPLITLISSFGLLALSIALTASRAELWWAQPLFWVSMVLVVLPSLLRLFSFAALRGERLGLTLLMGLELYLFKVLYSPRFFTFSDELQHYRTISDMLQTGHLFHENPILTVSPLFPGLEIVTHALTSLGGLSVYASGVLVLGVARLMLVAALFLVFELMSRSSRIAGLATFFYMANPHFILFDAQYGYESLAIPLLLVVLFLTLLRTANSERPQRGLLVMAIWCAGIITITHHITSYLMALLLLVWVIIQHGPWRIERSSRSPFWLLSAALIMIGMWTVLVASPVVGYIAPNIEHAVVELMRLIMREQVARELFRSGSGAATPLWAQIIGFGSTGLILLGIPTGLWYAWRTYRRSPAVIVIALVAAMYPATLAARFTESGLLVASRTAPYVFLGVAFILALAVTQIESLRWFRRLHRVIGVTWALGIFLGVLFTGLLAWGLPGPYKVDSYTRSVDAQNVGLADWMLQHLGANNRIAADNPNMLILGSFGKQHAITANADNVWVNTLFDGSPLSDDEYGILHIGAVEYVVYDTRISDVATTTNKAAGTMAPVSEQRTPFDSLDTANMVSDSGDIRVYDVRFVP